MFPTGEVRNDVFNLLLLSSLYPDLLSLHLSVLTEGLEAPEQIHHKKCQTYVRLYIYSCFSQTVSGGLGPRMETGQRSLDKTVLLTKTRHGSADVADRKHIKTQKVGNNKDQDDIQMMFNTIYKQQI